MNHLKKYQDRPIHFKGVHNISEWNFKLYEISDTSNSAPQASEWNLALSLAKQKILLFMNSLDEIPIGYIIYHKGYDSNYVVISWWSQENMLRMFAYTSSRGTPEDFNLVQDGLNICVWDMLIHAHERDAFVKHILSGPDLAHFQNYLQDEYKGY